MLHYFYLLEKIKILIAKLSVWLVKFTSNNSYKNLQVTRQRLLGIFFIYHFQGCSTLFVHDYKLEPNQKSLRKFASAEYPVFRYYSDVFASVNTVSTNG